MIQYLRSLTYVLAASLWLGGLTFYALVVVPEGTEVVGGTLQGFVTQRVTARLNVVGVICLAGMLWSTVYARRRSLWLAWSLMAAAQAVLFFLHMQLSSALDSQTTSVPDPAGFYALHRVYLLTTAAQWLACLWHLGETIYCWRSGIEKTGMKSQKKLSAVEAPTIL